MELDDVSTAMSESPLEACRDDDPYGAGFSGRWRAERLSEGLPLLSPLDSPSYYDKE